MMPGREQKLMIKKTAQAYLLKAIDTLGERGQQYDKSQQQERSMATIVTAFNQITGQDLTEAQGWAFMQVLKLVRLHSNPKKFHEDSALDSIAYAALAAECGAKNQLELNQNNEVPECKRVMID
jgi:hypothetical protein